MELLLTTEEYNMVNKGEETDGNIGREETDGNSGREEKGGIDGSEKGDINWNKKFDPENMSPEEMLKWIPFMFGRHAMPSKEELFDNMSDKVYDFSHYVTSSARLFKIETMVYLQVGFSTFLNGIDSLMATKKVDESKEMLVLGILEGALGHIQDKIDKVKTKREERIKMESNSKLN